jgi:translation initiation factor IF-2
MAKIRAYKLAEELGIERSEIVEKAAAVGVTIKSAMASLDDEDANRLRQKLGSVRVRRGLVTESRVERKAGGAIIRRRKKEPAPEPIVVAPEPVEPVVAEPVAPAAEVVPEVEEPIEAPAEPEPETVPEPEPSPAVAARPETDSRREAPESDRVAKQRKRVREVVNLREQERLARQATGRAPLRRQVMLEPRSMPSPRRRRRDAAPPKKAAVAAAPRETKRVVRVEGAVSVGELARMLGEKSPVVQKKLMSLGTMVSINQAVDVETARKVAGAFGYEVQDVGFREEEYLTALEDAESKHLEPRPPIITVMGHVDHGKTSLLDALRRSNVVAGEAGGITQHIGAYQVSLGDKLLTFIDTPGHEAFTAMRARGAQATDIVILVVAATEGIMPQTVEAIDHARAAGVPIVVAINKIDLPGANPQQARQRLLEHQLVPEEFGGDTICVDVSAKQGTGLEKLLEMVSLQAELLELKADPTTRSSGVVLEARLDKGRGPVATILVREGTLRRGDCLGPSARDGGPERPSGERGRSFDTRSGDRPGRRGRGGAGPAHRRE